MAAKLHDSKNTQCPGFTLGLDRLHLVNEPFRLIQTLCVFFIA